MPSTMRDKFFQCSIRREGKEIQHLATWREHDMVFVVCLAFIDFYFLTSFCTQFEANENINGKNVSLNGTSAHYLRIHPVSYNGASACMRIALYGCDSGKVKFDFICLFDCWLNVEPAYWRLLAFRFGRR